MNNSNPGFGKIWCGKCNKGKANCKICYGCGKVSNNKCGNCKGSGEVVCPDCNGKGTKYDPIKIQVDKMIMKTNSDVMNILFK